MVTEFFNDFYELFGKPNPGTPFNLIDDYRFQLVLNNLDKGSVLDVGVYFGDFLLLARKRKYQIFGTEINKIRKDFANAQLGEQVVRVDFRNGNLQTFEDSCVDNVVCMEVVEHVPDDKFAITELCRVAKSKVIITVPFNEKIVNNICIHCYQFTPNSGHLHSYDFDTLSSLVPNGWKIINQTVFAYPFTRFMGKILPRLNILKPIIFLIDQIKLGKGRWIFLVIKRQN